MKEQVDLLIAYAMRSEATDIHMVSQNGRLKVSLRTRKGYTALKQDIFEPRILDYLKFISGMDLCSRWVPQSGQFLAGDPDHPVSCRFSIIENKDLQTGVIRLLHTRQDLPIDALTSSPEARSCLHDLVRHCHGLYLFCGPTGSGKTTTLHAILHEMAEVSNVKIVSLEDPIEIPDESYLQLEINEAIGFTYETGIEELLRHDPDVILIGECRTAYAAAMAVRCALTGHVCLTTIHAGSGPECLRRILELGVSKDDLRSVLSGIFAQRLLPSPSGRECLYEIWQNDHLESLFKGQPAEGISLYDEARKAIDQGYLLEEALEMIR